MPAPDPDRNFPPTAWTVVLSAQGVSSPDAEAAREQLCRAYWQPVAAYLRALGMSEPDAEDGAQEVMARVCRDETITQIDPSKGRLRHFFKAAARNQFHNLRRHHLAQKRGHAETCLSTDALSDAETPVISPESDALFDYEWARTIFDRALKSLEQSYALRGKGGLLAALQPALVGGDEGQRYSDIGAAFGVGEAQIRLEVHRLRRRLGERLRVEAGATLGPVSSPAEIEEEVRYLVQTLAQERE